MSDYLEKFPKVAAVLEAHEAELRDDPLFLDDAALEAMRARDEQKWSKPPTPDDLKARTEDEWPGGRGKATGRANPNVDGIADDDEREATEFLLSLGDDEEFEFLRSVKAALAHYGGLTPGQVRGVLKCKRARERRESAPASNGRKLADVPAGRYAVKDSKEKLRFLEIERAEGAGKWAGTTFLAEVYGGGSSERRGYIGPDGTSRYVSDETAALLDQVRADPLAASIRYGRELGVCGVCGRTLTDAESRAAGIGPVCARKF